MSNCAICGFSHTSAACPSVGFTIPQGYLDAEKDRQITALRAENERLKDDAIQNSEYMVCDCCESLTTDAVDAGGHMQCRSCTESAALRARVAELEGVLQEIIDYADEGEIQDGVKAARAALAGKE